MPLAVLKLEFIGENYTAYRRSEAYHEASERYGSYLGHDQSTPWVKRVLGYNEQFGFLHEAVRGQKDYSQANSVGSRGIYLYYPLKKGVYEVNERITWSRVRRYFILVDNAEYVEVSKEEVFAWLEELEEKDRPQKSNP